MVYKIRNKAFFLTQSGWKNTYHCKVLNDVVDINPSQTYIIRAHEDAHPYVRYFAQYRNFSRKVKQYMYGDRAAETAAILWLKDKFTFVWRVETPIRLVQPAPDQRIVGQGDRDYELVVNNSHPYQLYFYQTQNEYLEKEREDQALRDQGETPLVDQAIKMIATRVANAKEAKGDELTTTELHVIFEDVYTNYRIAEGAQKARKPNGDFNDFLEVRRPYIEPGVNNVQVKVD